MNFKIFDEGWVGIEMGKLKTLINRTLYLGCRVLELCKLHLYRFHYESLMKNSSAPKMLFRDADSVIYSVETADINKELFSERVQCEFSYLTKRTLDLKRRTRS